MKTEDYKSAIVESLTFAFQYEHNIEIEKLVYEFEKAFSASLFDSNKAQLTRVPQESPPPIPRFVLQSKNRKILEVSCVEAKLTFSFSDKDIDVIASVLKRNTSQVFNFLINQKEIKLENCASIIILNIPSRYINKQVQNDIFEKFMRFKKPEQLNKISFMFEEEKENFLFAYNLGHYQKLNYQKLLDKSVLPAGNPIFVKLEQKKMDIEETGLSLNVSIFGKEDVQFTKSLYDEAITSTINQVKEAPERFLS